MPNMKYGASNCIPLHRGHKQSYDGWHMYRDSYFDFCRKTESFMLTLCIV